MRRLRPATLVLLALIVVLGYSLVLRQNRDTRLRAALALYKQRAGGGLRFAMGLHPPLAWPHGTPLGEAVRRIAAGVPGARETFPNGLPIVVDPEGLHEAGKTLESPVPAPPKDPIMGEPLPLARQLRAILEPLGLAAEIQDGTIVITSRGWVGEPVDVPAVEGEP